ncbi:hypothetical protein N0V90_006045 [Kalmusia sp. IMI 367209]|nr:hypothetical protein N0V90_006045 [Kalmusia sp. IMI 367209]
MQKTQAQGVDSKLTHNVNAGAQRMPKAHIELLEAQVTSLRSSLSNKKAELTRLRSASEQTTQAQRNATQQSREATSNARPANQEHAMSFISMILGTLRNEAKRSLYVLNNNLNRESQLEFEACTNRETNEFSLLTIEQALTLMNTYLRRGHPRHPFLSYNTVVAVCNKVLYAEISQTAVSDEDIFRAYAIFAIGAAYRNQELVLQSRAPSLNDGMLDPTRLFDRAMRVAAKVPFLSGIEGIQNLLLIARYGFFYLTGASLWDISALCIHICIDNRLHIAPETSLDAFTEQMQRRVFWQCYNLNRHCAATLGLPFSISDEDITVGNIINIEDEHLLDHVGPLDAVVLGQNGLHTSLSLMICQTWLRQIVSRMQSDFKRFEQRSKQNLPLSAGIMRECENAAALWEIHFEYLEQLSTWRSQYPLLADIDVSSVSYLGAKWRDLHYFQEKLLLIRYSIEHSPMPLAVKNDPLSLIEELYDCASNIVRLYSQLLLSASMEPTTGRLYRILTAGLSVLFAVVVVLRAQDHNMENLPSRVWLEERVGILKLCRDTLESMSTLFTVKQATVKYVGYFDVLCREVLRNFAEPSLWAKQVRPANEVDSATAHASVGSTVPTVPPELHSEQSIAPAQVGIDVNPSFPWLINSQLDFSLPLNTCQDTQTHIQPCNCSLSTMMNFPTNLSSEYGLEDPYIGETERLWMTGSTNMDDLLVSDWGDIF